MLRRRVDPRQRLKEVPVDVRYNLDRAMPHHGRICFGLWLFSIQRAWWANLQIAPLPLAQELWATSPAQGPTEAAPLPASLGLEASPR